MASLNKVFLMGNVTRDMEIRYTPNGAAVCNMPMAVNRVYGEGQEETTFVDVTVWNKQAESCVRYLRKGSPVLVEARLQLDEWIDRDTGKKRNALKVVAERVQFLSTGRRETGIQEVPADQVPAAPQVPGMQPGRFTADDRPADEPTF